MSKPIQNYEQARQAMLVLISRLDGIEVDHFLQAIIDAVKISINQDMEHPNCPCVIMPIEGE